MSTKDKGNTMKILSIDSGVERTGFAIFKKNGQSEILVEHGCILTSKSDTLSKRLNKIRQEIEEIIKKNKPDAMILETIFFNSNQKTVISIAQAQGVLIELAAQYDTSVEFLTPLAIKQTLTGYGRSDKKSVQKMVNLLLKLKTKPKYDDEVDAIACGLAYCAINKFHNS